ncbi:Ran-binding proteins 9/10 homolog [Strongyloides ratti]|uniref:Ran-binding proteins 9/10 homolog n=1 Tax=Strongyloides ratti TaxID=34506 RepID=A0A090LA57_STRRB|nr:Ran-binding proteins 9/10 homolog [Strongyloides ratti]CEF64400.1 Ran-binding proteins 9/10 homolog [Strongyloides ratti]
MKLLKFRLQKDFLSCDFKDFNFFLFFRDMPSIEPEDNLVTTSGEASINHETPDMEVSPNFKSDYSTDDKEYEERLCKLYPYADSPLDSIPTKWNFNDKSNNLQLSIDGLKVAYKGPGRNHRDAASIRANKPIKFKCIMFYFEVHIIDKGKDGYMGVGVCHKGVDLNRLPGWDANSFGYHGDDGNFFASSGNGNPYGPTFTTGDVIGCGVDFARKHLFYTKNGEFLGFATDKLNISKDLYPVIGLQTQGETIDTNFGQKPFRFDFEAHLERIRKSVIHSFNTITVHSDAHIWLDNMVASYLDHNKFEETLPLFICNNGGDYELDVEDIQLRKWIGQLVSQNKTLEAVFRLNQFYPDILKYNKEFELLIKIQLFVDFTKELRSRQNSLLNEARKDYNRFERNHEKLYAVFSKDSKIHNHIKKKFEKDPLKRIDFLNNSETFKAISSSSTNGGSLQHSNGSSFTTNGNGILNGNRQQCPSTSNGSFTTNHTNLSNGATLSSDVLDIYTEPSRALFTLSQQQSTSGTSNFRVPCNHTNTSNSVSSKDGIEKVREPSNKDYPEKGNNSTLEKNETKLNNINLDGALNVRQSIYTLAIAQSHVEESESDSEISEVKEKKERKNEPNWIHVKEDIPRGKTSLANYVKICNEQLSYFDKFNPPVPGGSTLYNPSTSIHSPLCPSFQGNDNKVGIDEKRKEILLNSFPGPSSQKVGNNDKDSMEIDFCWNNSSISNGKNNKDTNTSFKNYRKPADCCEKEYEYWQVYDKVLKLGRELHSLASKIQNISPELYERMDEAFALTIASDEEYENCSRFNTPKDNDFLEHCVSVAIMEYHGKRDCQLIQRYFNLTKTVATQCLTRKIASPYIVNPFSALFGSREEFLKKKYSDIFRLVENNDTDSNSSHSISKEEFSDGSCTDNDYQQNL